MKMDFHDSILYSSLMDFKQFTTKEMSIKNDLIKHLQDANKSLTKLVNFQQEVISAIMAIYRKHIVKLLALSKFNIDDRNDSKYKGTIMEQAAMINEMFQVMKKAIALDSQEPLIFLQELARLQKENKDLRELLNIANKFGSFSVSEDIETQTIEEDLAEETINNDISVKDLWMDSNSGYRPSSVLVENNEQFTKQLNYETVSLESGNRIEPIAQEITNEQHYNTAPIILSELRIKNLIVKTV